MEKTKATKQMRKFRAERTANQNEKYAEANRKKADLSKLRDECLEAISGYGRALSIMSDKYESLENELKILNQNSIYSPTGAEFIREFGVSEYDVDWT